MLFVGRVLNAVLLPDQLAIEDDHRLLVFRIVSPQWPLTGADRCVFSGNLWLGFRCCAQTASENHDAQKSEKLLGWLKNDLGRRGSRAPVIASQNISTRCNVPNQTGVQKVFLACRSGCSKLVGTSIGKDKRNVLAGTLSSCENSEVKTPCCRMTTHHTS